MERITTPSGSTISFETYGSGPPLILVHGGFSNHLTVWQDTKALLAEHFSVYAVARRGRGESSATSGHTVEDEAADIAAVLRRVGAPTFLLGHSYGALCALGAAALFPEGVRSLVLYEPPYPTSLAPPVLARLEAFGERGDWDGLVQAFMLDVLQMPPAEVATIRASPSWAARKADARATLNDLRAAVGHRFDADRYRSLAVPTLFLVGSESPRGLYLTDALAAVLPDARVATLQDQAHRAMITAPELFVDSISEFLLPLPPILTATAHL